MKATIDELIKRTTKKEAGMVCQVVHCHMYVQYICMYLLGTHTYVQCVISSAYILYSHVHVDPVL